MSSVPAPPGPPARRLPREARMEQMLAAAYHLFAERGYATVTMDEVAAAVGVTKPLLYNYFGNKESLYLACMEPAGDALLAAVVAAVQSSETPAQALRNGMHAFFEFVDRDRRAWCVLFDETLPSEGGVALRVGEYRTRMTKLIADSISVQLPGARAEVNALSVALLGASEAMARWWLRTGELTAGHAADLLIATVEPGLSALAQRQRELESKRSAA